LASQARSDLLGIYIAVGSDNPSAAERLLTSIERKSEMLVHHPRLGRRSPDIGSSIRMLVEGPYVILYETRPDNDGGPIDALEIVRVVDGRRDLTRMW
jgi:toxin ParE1/3/4